MAITNNEKTPQLDRTALIRVLGFINAVVLASGTAREAEYNLLIEEIDRRLACADEEIAPH
jgi:hypothetical protein